MDAQCAVHYSDKPPAEAAPDLQTMDLPAFPPQDPAKIAAEQAAVPYRSPASRRRAVAMSVKRP
ncbi:MAG TPA: hypothetical protein VGT99_06840 [Gammaproteobacteria bacterium]|nr:hypothetical protein [Gammaproteobacteria bacterium]